jgi:hypothetical protein
VPPETGTDSPTPNPAPTAARLADRFLELSPDDQIALAVRLGLRTSEDRGKRGFEVFIEYFRRAVAEGKLKQLTDTIAQELPPELRPGGQQAAELGNAEKDA